jgi:hypothetical protein
MPDRNCSSDREIWTSWALGERLSEMALCRSSNDSLMWSDKRNNCGGLVAMVTLMRGGIVEGSRRRRRWLLCSSEARMLQVVGAEEGVMFTEQQCVSHSYNNHQTNRCLYQGPDRRRFWRVETGQGCSGARSADDGAHARLAWPGTGQLHGVALRNPKKEQLRDTKAHMHASVLSRMPSFQSPLCAI